MGFTKVTAAQAPSVAQSGFAGRRCRSRAYRDREADGPEAGDEAAVHVGPHDHDERQHPQPGLPSGEVPEQDGDKQREERKREQLRPEEEEPRDRGRAQHEHRHPDMRLARDGPDGGGQKRERDAAGQTLQRDEPDGPAKRYASHSSTCAPYSNVTH